MDWSKIKKVYMIGVKGVGMAMLAEQLRAMDIAVTGSDVAEEFMTDAGLRRAGVNVLSGFSAQQVPKDVDLLIYSTAYNSEHPEVAAALASSLPVLTYAECLAKIFNYRHGIAVCGSHGKTTVTAWLGFVLQSLNFRPAVMVGARVPQFSGSGLAGDSDLLIIEADEYQNKLRYLEPRAAILNNIDYDHPDFYPDPASYRQAFADFVEKLPAKGWLVVNADDAQSLAVSQLTAARVISVGFGEAAEFRATDLAIQSGQQFFRVFWQGQDLGMFTSQLIGRHNVANALAVIAAVWQFSNDLTAIREAVGAFSGAARRLEKRGEWRSSVIYDDYAHHPTEVAAALTALKAAAPDKPLLAVFHPHTFSRTKELFNEFVDSLEAADEIIILEIYASAREAQGEISSQALVSAARERYPQKTIHYAANLEAAQILLEKNYGRGETIALLGAGDVFRVADRLLRL